MYLEVGKKYDFVKLETGLSFIAECIQGLDSEDDYRVKVIESNDDTHYRAGRNKYISKNMLGDYFKVTEHNPIDEMARSVHIVMNPVLYELFLDLSLATKDVNWFNQLNKYKGVQA